MWGKLFLRFDALNRVFDPAVLLHLSITRPLFQSIPLYSVQLAHHHLTAGLTVTKEVTMANARKWESASAQPWPLRHLGSARGKRHSPGSGVINVIGGICLIMLTPANKCLVNSQSQLLMHHHNPGLGGARHGQ